MGVTLDYYHSLFMSVAATTMEDLMVDARTGHVTNVHTRGSACVWHQNGDKTTIGVLDELAEEAHLQRG
jgi:hypothetical protein